MMNRRVVVTGLGMVSPIGNDVASSWKAALEGKSGIDRITAFDASAFGCQIAGEVKDFDAGQVPRRQGSAPLRPLRSLRRLRRHHGA